MPNHITNVLTITGEAKDLNEITEKVKGQKSSLSFESFYPMPENIDKDETSPMPAWYDWRIANWGTKWDCYECSGMFQGLGKLEISFLTAWSTPAGALVKLSELYPNITIVCEFADEDTGSNVGELVFKSGEITEENIPNYSKESVEMANRIYAKADEIFAIS